MKDTPNAPIILGDPSSIAQAQAYQARRMAYVQRGDLDGLVNDLYTADARFHSFDFRAEGRAAIQAVIARMMVRLADLGPVRVEQLIAGRDFIWQELAIDGPHGRIEPYEIKLLRAGQVYLQLFGFKQGNLWQPGDLVDFDPPSGADAAASWHERYITYQVNQDADGLADDFFSAEARLVTAKRNIEGRQSLRAFFRQKFAVETGFYVAGIHHLSGDQDYAWFEATAGGSLGLRTVYDVMALQDSRVALQLVGTLAGDLPANHSSN